MPPKKRAAEGNADAKSPRKTKAAKVDKDGEAAVTSSPKRKPASSAGKKATPKTIVPTSAQFKEHALPLHVHITHTPPTIQEPGSSTDPTPKLSTDEGFIASMTLAPSTFSSGSFGWKDSKRVPVELVNSDGKKEVVMVMMSFNATVVGSKPGPSKTSGKKAKAKEDDEDESEDDDD